MTVKRLLALAAAVVVLGGCTSGEPGARRTPDSPSPSVSVPASPSSPAPGGTPSAPRVAPPSDAFPTPKLAWRACRDGFQCAMMRVPLDYTKPKGRLIEVSVIRLPATSKSRRIGSVFLNPGGPGGSGVQFARNARGLFTADVRARFDVVSFDPRGVNESTPVRCVRNDRELERILSTDPDPDSAAERAELIKISRDEAKTCGELSGWLLPHITTANAARDMDVLRRAVGDAKLTYVGYSYGTVLGALYAEQYPDRIRALVLDGAVDLSAGESEVSLQQSLGFERALDSYLEFCAGNRRCPFSTEGEAARDLDAALRGLFQRVERSPLPAGNGRTLGPSEALLGVAAGLYNREWGWPALGRALKSASDGSGTELLALFDNLVGRQDDGSYDNSTEALIAISCVDGRYPRDVAAYDRDAVEFAKRSPRFGRALAYGALPCAFWPAPASTRSGPVRAPGSPPIIVIGTTRDPATPYEWSQALASQLPKGLLLTYDGDGHTAYGFGRSSCIDRHVNTYLLTLKTPRPGTRC